MKVLLPVFCVPKASYCVGSWLIGATSVNITLLFVSGSDVAEHPDPAVQPHNHSPTVFVVPSVGEL